MDDFRDRHSFIHSECLSSDCWRVYENVSERDVHANSSCPTNTPGTCDRSLELFYPVLLTSESSELQSQHMMENTAIRGLLIVVALHGENIRAAVASLYTSRKFLTCLLGVFLFFFQVSGVKDWISLSLK